VFPSIGLSEELPALHDAVASSRLRRSQLLHNCKMQQAKGSAGSRGCARRASQGAGAAAAQMSIYLCLLDIAAGMDYLHSLGILHSDLKVSYFFPALR